ncbi:hypothetical protein JAAARDRAFT_36436 [Jaapia argillacea MUCL 33604]|uniref:Zn(2)-C6 fungal-type domain-containing protein n=1 Tax=Jaapia argillacea MUCL 33604 TaxID=933084 RepID=A0A067PR23_9AGAM|nr:hypothetical protein JAAARDRAFT_36436 [Jaapia argillacea MUCL 33604]
MPSEKSEKKVSGKQRGRYTSRACAECARKKGKCDGRKPICGACEKSTYECIWDRGVDLKGPRSPRKIQTLSNQIETYKLDVATLKAENEQLRAIIAAGNFREVPQLTIKTDVGNGGSDGASTNTPQSDDEDSYDESLQTPDQEADLDALCPLTEKLVLHDSDLQVYGATSVYRQSAHTEPGKRFTRMAEYLQFSSAPLSDEALRRHLPREVPLEREEHFYLLDMLFKFFTSWCMRVVPELFLRDMHVSLSVPPTEDPPKTHHYSPMLHNALLSLALAFSDKPYLRDVNTRRLFASKAKADIEKECEKPNISVVHALSLVGSFHSTQGEQTLGFMYFGISGRMSQALGLSVDCSPWVKSGLISDSDMLARNWAYWTTFSQDVCWSLHVGREFCVSEPCEKQRIPVPFVHTDFDQIPWVFPPQFHISPQPSMLSSTFKASCDLLMIARRIMGLLNGLNATAQYTTVLKMICEIDTQLTDWEHNLPKEVNLCHQSHRASALPHRLMLHLAYNWLFILLHRPFYRRPKMIRGTDVQDVNHVKMCNSAANKILKLLDIWSSLYTLRFAPITLIQVVYSAGTVFVLSAVEAASRRRAKVAFNEATEKAKQCITYLHETGQSWECGNQVGRILADLLEKQVQARVVGGEMEGAASSSVSQTSAPTDNASHRLNRDPKLPFHAPSPPSASQSSPHPFPDHNDIPPPFVVVNTPGLLPFARSPAHSSTSEDQILPEHISYPTDGTLMDWFETGVIPDMGMGMPSGESLPSYPHSTFGFAEPAGFDFLWNDSLMVQPNHGSGSGGFGAATDMDTFLEQYMKQQQRL